VSYLRAGGEFGTDLLCPLPDCKGTLYLELSGSMALGVPSEEWPNGGSPETPELSDMHCTWWQVVCDEGHTVGVPPYTGDDHAVPFKLSEFVISGRVAPPQSEDDQ
jgi:hypothetical protein